MRFATPEVPKSFRDIQSPQYKNIYSYGLGNRNLWGTETLLGDWNGEFLLIAKDFYPSNYIEQAIVRGDKAPYSHNPDAPTNRNLIKTLNHFNKINSTFDNIKCNFLYVSACFLLRADGKKREPLPHLENVLSVSLPVLRFTVEKMPNLRRVITMGSEAREAIRTSGLISEFRSRKLAIHSVRHPSYAMTDTDRFGEWNAALN